MKINFLLIIVFYIISGGVCFCQENQSNLYLIDELLSEGFEPVGNKITVLGIDKFYEIEISQKTPESVYFLDMFRQNFGKYKFIINEKFDTVDYRINFSNISIKPVYRVLSKTDFTGNKLFSREIRLSFDYEIFDRKKGISLFNEKIERKVKDSIDPEKINQIEDKRFGFTQGILPVESGIENYLFPAIIVTVSAAAIILFFAIRSN
ncbi:MAG: hypothetical protein JSS91_00515 [Bacteroidetes bacterium]|nr:hypothetical protein [Bacteroidota bacterium]